MSRSPRKPNRPSGKITGPAYAEAESRVSYAIGRGANALNLALDGLTRIPPLTGLSGLESLDLQDTQVSDLTPLAVLNTLKSLNLRCTQVSELKPLVGLAALQSLDLVDTQVSDLTPLSRLTTLKRLSLRGTLVSDIMPLSSLGGLQVLDLSYTPILNLEPLTGLAELRRLDLEGTRVYDLKPLLGLTRLIDAAQKRDGGLWFPDCRLADETLLHYLNLDERESTGKVINYLRGKYGLPPYPPILLGSVQHVGNTGSPPTLPAQGPGPHFAVRENGFVAYAPPDALDRKGNNIARLRGLHQPLANAANELNAAFGVKSNAIYPALSHRAKAYADIIAQPLESIDFNLLYAAGLRLENARAASERGVKDGIVPPLEDHQFEVLKSLSDLHSLFITGTVEGQELLADSERFEMTREDVAANKSDIIEVIEPLTVTTDFIDPEPPRAIVELAQEDSPIRHAERRVSYTYEATSNLLIVLCGYALVSGLIGTTGTPAAIAVLASICTHSKLNERGKDARQFALRILSDTTDAADLSLQDALKRGSAAVRTYILQHEAPLRRLAMRNPRFRMLIDVIDWLKKNSD